MSSSAFSEVICPLNVKVFPVGDSNMSRQMQESDIAKINSMIEKTLREKGYNPIFSNTMQDGDYTTEATFNYGANAFGARACEFNLEILYVEKVGYGAKPLSKASVTEQSYFLSKDTCWNDVQKSLKSIKPCSVNGM